MFKYSFIIPVYNVETYLHQCVDSILVQDYTNFEIILVDDGSPDICPAICDDYLNRSNRVKVIHKKNEGLSEARNDGLNLATGDYVIFLDSDDYWEGKTSLTNIDEVIKKSLDLDILLFKRTYVYGNGDIVKPKKKFIDNKYKNRTSIDVFNDLIKRSEFECSAALKVIKRSFLLNNNLFFKKGIVSEDIEWYLRVIIKEPSIDTFSKPIYMYRTQREGSITNSIGLINLLNTIRDSHSSIDNLSSSLNNDFIFNYKSYLAYQLTIVIGNYASLCNDDKNKINAKIRELDKLLLFDNYKKTKIIKYIYYLSGLEFTSHLLNIYLKQHKLGKISL